MGWGGEARAGGVGGGLGRLLSSGHLPGERAGPEASGWLPASLGLLGGVLRPVLPAVPPPGGPPAGWPWLWPQVVGRDHPGSRRGRALAAGCWGAGRGPSYSVKGAPTVYTGHCTCGGRAGVPGTDCSWPVPVSSKGPVGAGKVPHTVQAHWARAPWSNAHTPVPWWTPRPVLPGALALDESQLYFRLSPLAHVCS